MSGRPRQCHPGRAGLDPPPLAAESKLEHSPIREEHSPIREEQGLVDGLTNPALSSLSTASLTLSFQFSPGL